MSRPVSRPAGRPKQPPSSKLRARPIDLASLAPGSRTDLSLPLSQDSQGLPVTAPFIAVKGASPGPVLGVCAAIHGDELNGIRIIHRLLEAIEPAALRGILLCAPVANVPSFNAGQRRFPEDMIDLNHVFPGKRGGKPSEQYAYQFIKAFLDPIEYLVDIHTASEGRVNSMYVRADLHSTAAREMALIVEPQIILHGRSGDGTLRNAARRQGKPAITLEAGNPDEFQGKMARMGVRGMLKLMATLGMIDPSGKADSKPDPPAPVICSASRWLRTLTGGLLQLDVGLRDRVAKGEVIGQVLDPFGRLCEALRAPADGVVIGRSRSPLAVPGTRFCHLGSIGEPKPPRELPIGRLSEPLTY